MGGRGGGQEGAGGIGIGGHASRYGRTIPEHAPVREHFGRDERGGDGDCEVHSQLDPGAVRKGNAGRCPVKHFCRAVLGRVSKVYV